MAAYVHLDNSMVIVNYVLNLLKKQGIGCSIGTLYPDGYTRLENTRPAIPLVSNKRRTIAERINNFMFDGSPNNKQPKRLKMTIDMAQESNQNSQPYGEILPDIENPNNFYLYHARDTGDGLFPNNSTKPNFLYNWFSSYPFFDYHYDALYQYRLNSPITELLVITKNQSDLPQIFNKFGIVIKQLLTLVNIQINENESIFSDYAIAAFVIQVLNLNGMIMKDTFVILSKDTVDNNLNFTKLDKKTDDIGKVKDYNIAEGPNLIESEAPTYYSPELIDQIRHEIIKKALENKGGKKRKNNKKTKRKKYTNKLTKSNKQKI
jgi:hypothetical protein